MQVLSPLLIISQAVILSLELLRHTSHRYEFIQMTKVISLKDKV